MTTLGKPFPVMVNDFELFEQDLCPTEYEYFQKHIQAFRSMWEEKSIADKIEFVEEFFNYSETYGYIKDFPLKMDSKKKFFDLSKDFLIKKFSGVKYSVAQNLVRQIASIASNKEKILQLGSLAKSKDPFYNIETRDSFRTFFGEPGHADTFKKAVANMPLYTRFGGAICRVLRRWVEGFIVTPEMQEMRNRFAHSFVFEDRIPARAKACKTEKKWDSETSEKSGKMRGHRNHQKIENGIRSEKKEINNENLNEECAKDEGKTGGCIDKNDIDRKEKAKKVVNDQNQAERRRHHCGFCLAVETKPKLYKKCSLCKGKGTRFYCCKDCQANDWQDRHRQEHIEKGIAAVKS